jgi:predicted outer membrane lipoprotein
VIRVVLAAFAVVAALALELTGGRSTIRSRAVSALQQFRVMAAVESLLLMAVSVGMSFIIVFMLGPGLGEMLRFAAH